MTTNLQNEIQQLKKDVWYLKNRTITDILNSLSQITGDTGGEIPSIKNRLDECESELDVLDDALDTLSSVSSSNSASISSLTSSLSGLSTNVSNISTTLSSLQETVRHGRSV